MRFTEHLYSGFQGFCIGAIAMAYVADYNRSQLPFALMCLFMSIFLRVKSKN